MTGAFATWQPEYAARGLPTFPIENKREFGEPMTDTEAADVAASVFKLFASGDLRTGQHGAWFREPEAKELARDPYLFALIGWLKAANGPDAVFWVADGLADQKYLEWPRRKLSEARARAIETGWIEKVRHEMRGVPATYRWGPTAKARAARCC